jgi:Lipase (class 3)
VNRTKISRALELALACRCAYPDGRERIDELDLDSWHPFSHSLVEGFVGSTGKKVILAFRGSTSAHGDYDTLTWIDKAFTDWSMNLKIDYKQFHSGRVQGSYLDHLRAAWPEIRQLLADHGAKDKRLWITGHSLGGGLAALAGGLAHWENDLEVAGVSTYGAPLYADEAFARHYPAPLKRFEYRNDIFPHLPPYPAVVKLLRVLSADVEEALDRWFGPNFTQMAFSPVGKLQYIDRKGRAMDEKDEDERLVDLVTAMICDSSQLLQDHWIDTYCAAIASAD